MSTFASGQVLLNAQSVLTVIKSEHITRARRTVPKSEQRLVGRPCNQENHAHE